MATQTGSIDLTSSNAVKLAAEAGWQSDLEDYYTKSEINVTVEGINSEVSKKVNGTEIISSINQSAESVKIQASKVEIDGTAVFSAIKSQADAAYDAKDAASTALSDAKTYADTKKSEAISTAAADATAKANAAQTAATNAANTATDQKLSSYSTTQQMNEAIQDATGPLFYGRDNSSGYVHLGHVPYAVGSSANYSHLHLTGRIGGWLSTTSGSIDVTFKSRTDNALYNTVDRRDETIDTSFVDVLVYTGTDGFTHYWLKVNSYWYAQLYAEFEQFVEDDHTRTATEPDGTCVWKLSEHTAVAATKSNAVKRTQRIWYRKSASGAPSTPGTASSNWVTKADDGDNAWTKMHVAISSSAKYIYTCEQYEMADGTVGYTSVLLDNTITVIDGGNIITGSVTANKLNASDINASKTLTVGAMTDAAAATILNSNVQVGGRNLLVGSSTGANWSYSTFDPSSVVYTRSTTATTESFVRAPNMTFEAGETYTLSCWAKSNGNVTSMDMFKVHSSGGGSHQSRSNIALTTEYQKIVWTFACNAKSDEVAYVRFDNNGSTTSGTEAILYVKKPKLEKGNIATDGSPAPEDVDSAISDAAKTATSYVTDINSNGITVHPSRSDYATNGGRAVINGNGLTIYLGSDDVASYGASARIGKANSDRVTVDSTNGITVYKGNSKRLQTTANGIDVYGSDGATSVASFGATARVGAANALHVNVGTVVGDDRAVSISDIDGNSFVDVVVHNMGLGNGTESPSMEINVPDSSDSVLWLHKMVSDDGESFLNKYEAELCLGRFVVYKTNQSTGQQTAIVETTDTELNTEVNFVCEGDITCDGDITGWGDITCSGNAMFSGKTWTVGLESSSQIIGAYQLVAEGTQNSIALRANTVGHRGLYDVTNDEWILYRDGSNDNLVIKFLSSNFDIDAAVALSGSTSISANGVQTGTTNITKSGWVPVAIAGVNVNSHWAATVRWYLSARNSGTGTISWAVHNMSGTAAITPTVTFYVLWARGN